MPASRDSEMAQRAKGGSNVLKTSSSDSDPSHNRAARGIGERRPLRASTSESLNQKKLGSKIADLECQLGQAQQELKVLKGQLASAEAAKKDAQQQLKRSKKPGGGVKREAEGGHEEESEALNEKGRRSSEKMMSKEEEMKILRAKLEEKEKELAGCNEQKEDLKTKLAKQEETCLQLSQLGEELESSKAEAAKLNENLEAANDANKALEAEIKMMRVQTEQWRKAADAAAAVLAGGEINGSLEECVDDALRKPKGSGMKISDLWKKRT